MATKRFSELTPVSTIQNGDFFAIESAIGPYQKTTWSEIKAHLTSAGYANVNDSSLAFLATTFSVVGATAITLGTVPSSSGINIGSTGTYSGVINIGAIASAGRITIGHIGIVGLDLRATAITIQDSAGAGFSASGGGATMTADAAGVAAIVQNGKTGFEMTPASEVNVGHADYVTKLKGSKVVNTDSTIDVLHKPTKQYQIDGDFNNWTGTSISANGYGAATMWAFDLSGATGTFSQVAHATPNSKPYYARIAITAADNFARIEQRISGNPFHNKDLSVFIRCKYTTSAPTGLVIRIDTDGTGDFVQSSTISGIGASFGWIRVDISAGTLSPSTNTRFKIQNGSNETWDLDIDKIRIIETNGLASGIIPDWVKEDEGAIEMKNKVNSYYFNTWTTAVTVATGNYYTQANSAGILCDGMVTFPEEMVQTPTVTVYSPATGTGSKVRDITAAADVNSTANEVSTINCSVRDTGGGYTTGNVYNYHIEADARY